MAEQKITEHKLGNPRSRFEEIDQLTAQPQPRAARTYTANLNCPHARLGGCKVVLAGSCPQSTETHGHTDEQPPSAEKQRCSKRGGGNGQQPKPRASE